MTPLDMAHAAMEADPDNEKTRRQFYGLVAASELFVVLETEAHGNKARPLLLETDDGKVALAFDTEERLAGFSDQPVPYLAMAGRKIVSMLADSGVSLGLNLVGAPSAIVLPPEVISWMENLVSGQVSTGADIPDRVLPPSGVSELFLKAIDERLAGLSGLAMTAYLVSVRDGTELLLVVCGASNEAQREILRSLAEARDFVAPDQPFSVGFADENSAAETRLSLVGLKFEIPQPVSSVRVQVAPGSDPDKPPILK